MHDYLGNYSSISLKITSDGLQLIAINSNSGLIFYYKRSNIVDNFYLHSYKYTNINDFGVAISLDGNVFTHVTVTTPTRVFRVYSCGFIITNITDPPNGVDLIYQNA